MHAPALVAMVAGCVKSKFCQFIKCRTTLCLSYEQARYDTRSHWQVRLLKVLAIIITTFFKTQNITNTSSKFVIKTFDVKQLQHGILLTADT